MSSTIGGLYLLFITWTILVIAGNLPSIASTTTTTTSTSNARQLKRTNSEPNVNTNRANLKPEFNLTDRAASCSRNYQFDYLVLSLQWPLSFCYEKQECNLQIARRKRWSIHGLWPSRRPNRVGKRNEQNANVQKRFNNIQFCCGPQYNSTKIRSDVYRELIDKWPTLHNTTKHHSFWRHEWQKHGTCATTVNKLKNQTAYFDTILKLYNQFDLNSLPLQSNTTYPRDQFHQLIEPIIGKKIRLECSLTNPANISTTLAGNNNKPNKGQKVSIFSEVHICLDKNLEAIDCSRRDDHQCNNSILFP